MQEPRRVPSPAGDGIRYKMFFLRTCASEKTLLRPQVCERSECARRPVSSRRNACISEKRVELFRHDERPRPQGRGRVPVHGRGRGDAPSERPPKRICFLDAGGSKIFPSALDMGLSEILMRTSHRLKKDRIRWEETIERKDERCVQHPGLRR